MESKEMKAKQFSPLLLEEFQIWDV